MCAANLNNPVHGIVAKRQQILFEKHGHAPGSAGGAEAGGSMMMRIIDGESWMVSIMTVDFL